ncbi:hypothetical protein [Acaryochloris sp. IP29b_bin.137]|uniref:hypothetical protein n=1 Tax=Acaryochloris sp. IP29b_bin.137 TaxID=2969217 RepID=UPI00260EC0FB|nr:hypothetical protein [Acaryochloris sp. IP29b_bin.137]
MPSWITAYCPDSINDVTPKSLVTLRGNDFLALAEDYGVAGELVSPTFKLFKIEESKDGFQPVYRPNGERQLAIRCWTSPDRVAEEIPEIKEFIGGSNPSVAASIAASKAGGRDRT